MSSAFLSILAGLASAGCWGAGDFTGGYATKHSAVYAVIILSQLAGGILMFALAMVFAEPVPAALNLLIGGLAGMSGALGLVALYSGLATGKMGVVAPVAALVSVIMPVTFGIFNVGLPQPQQLVGFLFALLAVWLLSRGEGSSSLRLQDLKLPVAAGIGFGIFFILIDQVSSVSLLWPLVSARFASVTLILLVAVIGQKAIMPERSQLLIITLAGIFDSGGNAFYALATRMGRLDISAILASLYSAVTVLLAWIIMRERLTWRGWLGVSLALIALLLITV
jgi:drug/metabolite transporter (DMT)-like permease